jgi:hypothetical protein
MKRCIECPALSSRENDRPLALVGASYRGHERVSFDVGYSVIDVSEADILMAGADDASSNRRFGGKAESHMRSTSLELHFISVQDCSRPTRKGTVT